MFIYIFYGNFGSMLGQMAKKALEKPYITRLFEGAASFKLNRGTLDDPRNMVLKNAKDCRAAQNPF